MKELLEYDTYRNQAQLQSRLSRFLVIENSLIDEIRTAIREVNNNTTTTIIPTYTNMHGTKRPIEIEAKEEDIEESGGICFYTDNGYE
ncbi:12992_t:CDS:2 [Ambispora leptoticha]|uniref:12992_t:CDS:1 n=1 Tax=Ambispora leptoticha TaxID=144679 RepID=A0A9N8W5Y4_9GLOM|nr:12992_t:CDS:2 [Ambispora leptoticha]